MCEVNSILIVLKGALPRECVVVSCVFTLHGVLVVANVRARSDPASPCFLSSCLRVHQGAHSVVIKGIWLNQVDDVESVVLSSLGIGNAEVVPLGVPPGVIIRL